MELLFPNEYIQNISERMDLYKRLDSISDEENLVAFEHELTDRFGELPIVSKELIQVVRLRWLCSDMGIEKLVMKNGKMTAYFVSDFNSKYYQSQVFGNILLYAQSHPRRTQFREQNGKRSLLVSSIDSITMAYNIFMEIKG